jgi:uncharacterized repeat protein (TIGR01451 family)
VFDVVVANVSPGSTIANTATINNPNGPDAAPSAPTVPVSPSQVAQGGTKQLYLWSGAQQRLSRTRPSGIHAGFTINGNNQSQAFVLAPALQTPLVLNAGNFSVNLLLARSGSNNDNRTVNVTLYHSGSATPIATTSATLTDMSTSMTNYTFTLSTAGLTVPQNATLRLVVGNSSTFSNRQITLTPYSGAQYSRVDLNSATVINVDSVTTWSAAFNNGAAQNSFYPGNTVYVRAQVSDPFGSFDISSARITVIDPGNVTRVDDQLMTEQGAPATCDSQAAATCIFQYAYPLPAAAAAGGWTIRVIGHEGVEGVSDLGVGSFTVTIPQPSLTVLKTSTVLSDPVNQASNPRRIPLAVVRYDISVTNSGPGTVDAGTLVLTDPVPANSSMYVGTSSPVVFINGPTASGLTYNYPANVSYSSAGAAGPWDYVPTPDPDGFDAQVRAVRITPGGVMSAASGANSPSFTVQFRVRIH